MNHENVTDQIDALAEDLQGTKDTLLAKLEVNINNFNIMYVLSAHMNDISFSNSKLLSVKILGLEINSGLHYFYLKLCQFAEKICQA